jgi:NOL1/NOP2/fmu family ribosome biogenesis protein
LLKREDGSVKSPKLHKCTPVKLSKETEKFLEELKLDIPRNQLELHEDRLYLLPTDTADLKGIHVLRSGLYLGDIKKNRFEPSQALANALRIEEYEKTIVLSVEDDRVIKYLKGETIEIEDESKSGWQLICVGRFPLGWAKADRGTLKNKYYAGWRWM